MAKSSHYSRWKRVAMQASMWTVLAASVGLAALVSRQRTKELTVRLGEPQRVGRVMVRLPEGWGAERRHVGRDVQVFAQEPPHRRARRELQLTLELLPDGQTDAHLRRLEEMSSLPRDQFERFDFLGQPGYRVQGFNPERGERTNVLYAATMLPAAATTAPTRPFALGVYI